MFQSVYSYLSSFIIKEEPKDEAKPIFLIPKISNSPKEAIATANSSGDVRKPWKNTSPESFTKINLNNDSTLSKEQIIDKIKGIIYGAALGDAIGLATEFMSKEEAAKFYPSPLNFSFADIVHDEHRDRWVRGDWTDVKKDTDQMIIIMESAISKGGLIDEKDFAKRFYYWFRHGYPELGDLCALGIGQTVFGVLRHPLFQSDPFTASKDIWERNEKKMAANGAIMRTSILGILSFPDIQTVIENTLKISNTTHYDPRCGASSVAITSIIAMILQGKRSSEEILHFAYENAEKIISQSEDLNNEMKEQSLHDLKVYFNAEDLEELQLDEKQSIGFTFKAMGAAICCYRSVDNFKEGIIKLIMEGGDADSNAAVAGALLGAKLGFSNLPRDWIDALVHRSFLDEHLSFLFDLLF